jgi:heme O synthase-like polyprenyltransferase
LAAAIASVVLFILSVRVIESFKATLDKKVARKLFKVGSPMLAVIFVLEAAESLILIG